MLSTSQTCVRMHCRTSLVPTTVLHSYSLLVCRLHCGPAFARVAELLCYPLLSYIRTRCSYAVNVADLHSCVAEPRWYLLLSYIRTHCVYAVYTADLRSHALQRLAGAHCCSTFAPAACMLSTSLTCFHTRCRASLVPTAILHSPLLRVCRHCRWLHPYALLICHLHRGYAFVRVAELHCYPLLSYISTRCSSAVNIVDLRGYALQNLVAMHGCPTFLHAACLPPFPLATSIRAARLPSTSLTCVRLQSFFGTHCGPTFVHATCLPSRSSTCVDTHCRTSSL